MAKTVMIFPGQGAFYTGALQNVRLVYPAVDALLKIVERVALRRLGRSLIETIWDEKNSLTSLVKSDPNMLQLAIYTISVAAYEVLHTESIVPDVLVGHSFGEIAALTCAGVYTSEQGAEIVCDRIESMATASSSGGRMAAISASPEKVTAILQAFIAGRPPLPPASALTIAVENHDTQVVVSGAGSEIEAFLAYCAEQKISATPLHSPYAFHHPGLNPAASVFAARLATRHSGPLRCAVYSPILGRYYQDNDDFGMCLARHLVLPVKFRDAVRFLRDDGASAHIECGALDALSKIIIRVLGPANAKVFPTFTQKTDELTHVRRIVHYFNEGNNMNTRVPAEVLMPEFEAFWNERSPIIMSQIKAEFIRFLEQEQVRRAPHTASQPVAAVMPVAQAAALSPSNAVPTNAAPAVIPRAQLFGELVNLYAEAMEYPPEVFSEVVELEAELGIDSVKQTEIIGRISALYHLPPLPANFRSGDFKTMGQIVDFVFAHQGKAGVPA